MFDYTKFRKKLKKYRLQLGYTQEQFAEKINIDYKYFGQIEIGARCPSTTIIIEILNFFQLSYLDFFEGSIDEKLIEINSCLKKLQSCSLDEQTQSFILKTANLINKKNYKNEF